MRPHEGVGKLSRREDKQCREHKVAIAKKRPADPAQEMLNVGRSQAKNGLGRVAGVTPADIKELPPVASPDP